MEYIDTLKCITKPLLSILLFIPFSCRNITVFGSCQVFDESILGVVDVGCSPPAVFPHPSVGFFLLVFPPSYPPYFALTYSPGDYRRWSNALDMWNFYNVSVPHVTDTALSYRRTTACICSRCPSVYRQRVLERFFSQLVWPPPESVVFCSFGALRRQGPHSGGTAFLSDCSHLQAIFLTHISPLFEVRITPFLHNFPPLPFCKVGRTPRCYWFTLIIIAYHKPWDRYALASSSHSL